MTDTPIIHRSTGTLQTWAAGLVLGLADTPGTWFTVCWLGAAPDKSGTTAGDLIAGKQARNQYAASLTATKAKIYDSGPIPAATQLTLTHLKCFVGQGYTNDSTGVGSFLYTRDGHPLLEFRVVTSTSDDGGPYTAVTGYEQFVGNSKFCVISGPSIFNIEASAKALDGYPVLGEHREAYKAVFPLFAAQGNVSPYVLSQDNTESYTCVYWRDKMDNLIVSSAPITAAATERIMVQARIPSLYASSNVGVEFEVDAFGYLTA